MAEEPTAEQPVPTPGGGLGSTIIWRDKREPGVAAPMPKTIGRCHVRRVIGTGGMGTVYEAMQEEPRRTVAIKVMRLALASPAEVDRFKREAQLLARLHHSGIAQVYEVGTFIDGAVETPYFIMEFIPAALAITDFARQNKLDVRRRLMLFAQVCDAVQHGNQKGVIHRDLKPSNILVDATGHVRIIDFGVARATDSDLAISSLHTSAGELVGTLQYMSPEQAKADPHDIDSRSDVYSLGIVLYELLVDRLPYDVAGSSVYESISIIKDHPPTRISVVNSSLRGDLETIVHKALEKQRERRYQTAGDLHDDILRYLNDEPIIAKPPTISYVLRTRARKFMVRHPAVAYLIAMLVAGLFAEFVGVPLIYRWTYLNEGYVHALGQYARPVLPETPFRNVRVIALDAQSFEAVDAISKAAGGKGVSLESRGELRLHHGELMERLAQVGVRAVVFDISFPPTDNPRDDDFVRGVKALREKNVDVVVSGGVWTPDRVTPPDLSDAILPHVKYGGATAGFGTPGILAWPIEVVVQRGNIEPVPSMALAGCAAYLHPGMRLGIAWYPEVGWIATRYFKTISESPPVERLEDSREIQLTAIELFQPSENEDSLGLDKDDLIGKYEIHVPPAKALIDSTLRYEWALQAPVDELRRAVEGKLIMIGYALNDEDIYDTVDGRRVNGVYGQAAAVDSLIRGQMRVLVERAGWSWLLIALAALAGIVTIVSMPKTLMRAAIILVLCILAVAASAALYRFAWITMNPFVPILALLISAALALGVYHVRLAHSPS